MGSAGYHSSALRWSAPPNSFAEQSTKRESRARRSLPAQLTAPPDSSERHPRKLALRRSTCAPAMARIAPLSLSEAQPRMTLSETLSETEPLTWSGAAARRPWHSISKPEIRTCVQPWSASHRKPPVSVITSLASASAVIWTAQGKTKVHSSMSSQLCTVDMIRTRSQSMTDAQLAAVVGKGMSFGPGGRRCRSIIPVTTPV
eukprot:3375142-Rhodomonas_salina.2